MQLPRHITLFLLSVLILPLLAACGGSAGFTSGSGEAPSAPTANAGLSSEAAAPQAGMGAPVPPPAAEPTAAPAAPAATMAPAGTMAPPEAALPAADAAARESVGEVPGVIPPPPPRPVDQQSSSPLKAGEIDDNANFADYLSYVNTYQNGGVRQVDVSERYIITVVNNQQQPVLDARVRIFSDQQQVFEARTYAGGRTIFFPRAAGLSPNVSTLRVQIEKGNSTVEGTLTRGQDDRQTFVLDGATAIPQPMRLDVLFLLDATGSMGDEITQVQQTIDSIAARIDQIQPRPELRLGLVAYRDRGDAYVTQLYSNFTADVPAFREALLQVSADGGGDTPEDLNEGLNIALNQMSWSEEAVRLVFLVADAPAHIDYGQQFDYVSGVQTALAKGVKIYPIGASNTDQQAEYQFRQLAQQTLASFIFLTYQQGQSSGTPGESTEMNVDPEAFTVERLDDLVVQVVERELKLAQGAG